VASTAAGPVHRNLRVLEQLGGRWAPTPVAYDGRDVWVAPEDFGGHAPIRVALQRRSAVTGRLLDRVSIPQEAVFAIAAGEGTLWAVGGGDGGVPDTTVSVVDVASHHVVFTRTLSKPCSCEIAVGANAGWLAGQGATHLIRLDPTTGEIAATIALPGPSESLAVLHGKVQVGLDNSRVAVVDPATNTIERIVTIAALGQAAAGAIVGITPIGTTWDSWVTRTDGRAFELVDNTTVVRRPVTFLAPLVTAGVALAHDRLWAVRLDQLFLSTTDDRTRGYANYDGTSGTFGRLQIRSRRFVPTISGEPGFDQVVATGSTLWIATFNGPVLVVAPS
jgi:hypothetical protein